MMVRIGAALGATCVIHMSSGAVYAPSDGPINEEALIDPRHPYGRSKHDAEQAAGAFGPPAIFLRLGNVAGCDGLAAALRTRDCIDLDVFSDGTSPRRSYLAPDDLAHALADLCRMACVPERFAPGLCLNVAGSHPVAMDALLRAAQRPFRLQDAPQGALPLQHLDVCRLKDLGISLPQSADPAHLAKFLPPLAVASSLGTPEQRGTA